MRAHVLRGRSTVLCYGACSTGRHAHNLQFSSVLPGYGERAARLQPSGAPFGAVYVQANEDSAIVERIVEHAGVTGSD